jgi:SAM-dependent methyltransferase
MEIKVMSNTESKTCRLCEAVLPEQPMIKLENVPRGGHALPKAEELAKDFGVDLEIYECQSCGLVQLATELLVYDDGVGSAHAYSPGMISHREKQAFEFIDRFNLKDKNILDVGCGDGHFMAVLVEAGAKAFGIEPSERSTELGRQQGFCIQQGCLGKNIVVNGNPFDGFVTLHVLEHTPDPNDFLQGIYENLNENAVGFIEVPSFEQTLENQRVYDFITDHLSYFSLKTLRFALEKNGFEVLEIERNWGGEHLVATVRKQPKPKLTDLRQSVNHLIAEMVQFVDGYTSQGKSVALWGASTNGVTLLSLARLEGIAYVVDSSPHKQNRFTPVSHLPIFSPHHLKQQPVDVVLVMANRFTDEIVHQLETEIQFSGTIAVLKGKHLEVIKVGI